MTEEDLVKRVLNAFDLSVQEARKILVDPQVTDRDSSTAFSGLQMITVSWNRVLYVKDAIRRAIYCFDDEERRRRECK